eukprot:TRINITY_DN17125_c0_g1_i1.p1 TRINITY_DN17125_c0_g1~~TRINITY_DN17125_c0_g1_i1.p1  ORF type:complete len:221 (+),score=61.85 TRINITY_DN17125_c0_g1_i1:60-665(+)
MCIRDRQRMKDKDGKLKALHSKSEMQQLSKEKAKTTKAFNEESIMKSVADGMDTKRETVRKLKEGEKKLRDARAHSNPIGFQHGINLIMNQHAILERRLSKKEELERKREFVDRQRASSSQRSSELPPLLLKKRHVNLSLGADEASVNSTHNISALSQSKGRSSDVSMRAIMLKSGARIDFPPPPTHFAFGNDKDLNSSMM